MIDRMIWKLEIHKIECQRTGVSTFASRTNQSTDQSLQKSFHLSHADKIELKKISSPSENKKYANAQTNTTQTMTVKLNKDNGLQARWTRTPAGDRGQLRNLADCSKWANLVPPNGTTTIKNPGITAKQRMTSIRKRHHINDQEISHIRLG